MEYRKFGCDSYNIYTIKTDKFKTIRMEIIFSREVDKKEMPIFTFLSDIITDCSKEFQRRKDITIKLEELYITSFYGNTSKVGNLFTISFIVEFIAPAYINEKDYLKNAVSFPFQIICNPKVQNNEFDLTNFNIVKRRVLENIESIKESSERLAIINALKTMDDKSPSSFSILGNKEDIDDITPSILYEYYHKLLNTSNCDIFLIGDANMEEIVKIIKSNFKNRVIKLNKPNIVVNNNIRKKPIRKNETSNFIQSTLVMIYNIKGLNKQDKDIAFHVFNYLLGSGGITSKLYQKLRTDNSLCYSVRSMYFKNDELLTIEVSLDDSNILLAEKLIKKCIKEMVNGDYKEETIKDAINNLNLSLKMSSDNNILLLSNYMFNIFDDLPLIEKRSELLKKVTKDDLIRCAKSLVLNTIYIQNRGEQNEGN